MEGDRMNRLIFGTLALTCCALPALARAPAPAESLRSLPMHFDWHQEGPAEVCGKSCRTWISATGTITGDTPRDFDTFAKARDVRGATLVLDSEGGSTLGAMAFGRAVRSLNISTTVGRTTELPAAGGKDPRAQLSPRAECESMCTFVLLAGVKRSVPLEARVLVHQIWLGDRRNDATAAVYSAEDLVLVERDIGRLAIYTVEMGGGIELLDMALRIPPWEPMRLLTQDELRRMRLSTVDDPFDRASVAVATNSSPSTTGFDRIANVTERGWALVERSGSRALARRHPLTKEGEDIGRFDLIFSCADTNDAYNITYVERRSGLDQHALAPLKDVTIALGSGNATLKIVSSELSSKPTELASVARGTVAATLVRSFADASNRSLTVFTSSNPDTQTAIRVGNTGVADGFPQFAAGCGKKTAAAN
jgi:hypothetical protein